MLNIIIGIIIITICIALINYIIVTLNKIKTKTFINNYKFPSMVIKKFKRENPKLNDEQVKLVEISLKEYFKIQTVKGKRYGMPSEITDSLWHNFILEGTDYERFCKEAFGKTLHHKAESDFVENKDLRNHKLSQDLINTYKANKELGTMLLGLPLLFAIDTYLKVEDGYTYSMLNIENQIKEAVSEGSSSSSGCSTVSSYSSCSTSTSICSSSSSSSSSSCSSGSSCGSGCGGGD